MKDQPRWISLGMITVVLGSVVVFTSIMPESVVLRLMLVAGLAMGIHSLLKFPFQSQRSEREQHVRLMREMLNRVERPRLRVRGSRRSSRWRYRKHRGNPPAYSTLAAILICGATAALLAIAGHARMAQIVIRVENATGHPIRDVNIQRGIASFPTIPQIAVNKAAFTETRVTRKVGEMIFFIQASYDGEPYGHSLAVETPDDFRRMSMRIELVTTATGNERYVLRGVDVEPLGVVEQWILWASRGIEQLIEELRK